MAWGEMVMCGVGGDVSCGVVMYGVGWCWMLDVWCWVVLCREGWWSYNRPGVGITNQVWL